MHVQTSSSSSSSSNIADYNSHHELDRHIRLEKAGEQYSRKLRSISTDYLVSFHGLDAVADKIEQILQRVVARVLYETSQSSNTNDERDIRARFVVQSASLDYPISIPFSSVENITARRLMDELQRVLNSNQTFEIGDALRLNLLLVSLPSMGTAHGLRGSGGIRRRHNVDFRDWKRAKRSIIRVAVSRNACLLAALAIGRMVIMKPDDSRRSTISKTSVQNALLAEFCREIDEDCLEANLKSAVLICRGIARKRGRPGRGGNGGSVGQMLTIGDAEALTRTSILEDFQVAFYDSRFFGSHLITYGQGNGKRINLLYDEVQQHVDVITSLSGLFDCKVYCNKCEKPVQNQKHSCTASTCHFCRLPGCAGGVYLGQTGPSCESCGYSSFKTTACFETHKREVCREYYCCSICQRRGIHKSVQHKCYKTFCQICKTHYDAGPDTHKCYIQKPKRKDQQRQDEQAYSVFDIETDQSKIVQGTSNAFHCPILLVLTSLEEMPNDQNHGIETFCGCQVFRGYDCIDKFCRYIFMHPERKDRHETFFAHYGSGFDFIPILDWLQQQGEVDGCPPLIPQVIFQSSKVLSLKAGNKTFRDSYLFIPIPLSAFSKTFSILEWKKGHFPHLMSTRENQDFVGQPGEFPALRLFGAERMSKPKFDEFAEWHADMRLQYFEQGLRYDYSKELLEYCVSDVKVLKYGVLKFKSLISQITNGEVPNIYAIGMTAASSCNYIYRKMYMPPTLSLFFL